MMLAREKKPPEISSSLGGAKIKIEIGFHLNIDFSSFGAFISQSITQKATLQPESEKLLARNNRLCSGQQGESITIC